MFQFAPTPHELRLKIAALLAIAGGLLAFVMFGATVGPPLDTLLSICGAAVVGAGLAGIPTAALFGQSGKARDIWAVLGALLATVLGSALAGMIYFAPWSLFFVSQGTMGVFGVLKVLVLSPMIVGMGLWSITSGPVWLLLMTLVHVIAIAMRRAAQ